MVDHEPAEFFGGLAVTVEAKPGEFTPEALEQAHGTGLIRGEDVARAARPLEDPEDCDECRAKAGRRRSRCPAA